MSHIIYMSRQLRPKSSAIAGCAGDCHQGRRPCADPSLCVIETDNHWPLRLIRWIEGEFRVIRMRYRLWLASRRGS